MYELVAARAASLSGDQFPDRPDSADRPNSPAGADRPDSPAGTAGPIAPAPVGRRGTRPVLATVTGPALVDLIRMGPTAADPTAADPTATGTRPGLPVRELARFGELLAALHGRPAPVDQPARLTGLPWTPLLLETWLGRSGPQRTLAAEFATRPDVVRAAEEVRTRLASGTTWVHGDARVDNVRLRDGAPLLIDWELTGVARPEHDLATACASLLTCAFVDAIQSTGAPTAPGAGPVPTGSVPTGSVPTASERARAELRTAIGRSRALVRPFLAAYRALRPFDDTLVAAGVGVGLLAAGWSRCLHLPLDRRVRALVDLGASLVTVPARWAAIDG